MSFAEWITKQREKRGWTQRELARRAKVSSGTMFKIESGTTNYPTQDTVEKLAAALHLPYERLDRVIRGLPPELPASPGELPPGIAAMAQEISHLDPGDQVILETMIEALIAKKREADRGRQQTKTSEEREST